MIIFFTGATGTVGRRVVAELLLDGHEVHVMARNGSTQAEHDLLNHPKLRVWNGDLTNPDLLLKNEGINYLYEKLEVIVHLGALYNLRADRQNSYLHNVVGTQGILYFANQCRSLKHFIHMSTIAVAGDFQGEFKESNLECQQEFANNYALTKYEAELLFRSWKLKAKKTIIRPGVVVGDSLEGKFERTDGPYYFLEGLSKLENKKFLLETLKYLPIPFKRGAELPLVPVDCVSKSVIEIINHAPEKDLNCYHLISSANATVQELLQDSFKAFGFNVEVIPLPETKVNDLLMDKIGLPKELLTYLYSLATFTNHEFIKDYPQVLIPSYYQFKENFFNGAKLHFQKKKGVVLKSVSKTEKVKKVAKKAADFIRKESSTLRHNDGFKGL